MGRGGQDSLARVQGAGGRAPRARSETSRGFIGTDGDSGQGTRRRGKQQDGYPRRMALRSARLSTPYQAAFKALEADERPGCQLFCRTPPACLAHRRHGPTGLARHTQIRPSPNAGWQCVGGGSPGAPSACAAGLLHFPPPRPGCPPPLGLKKAFLPRTTGPRPRVHPIAARRCLHASCLGDAAEWPAPALLTGKSAPADGLPIRMAAAICCGRR